ncbi:MAG: helix-turn-helix domain-containing protein [Methylophilaceae bacterium]
MNIGDMGIPTSPSKLLFGRRLREARQRAGIAQDKLGVMIGLDEASSSARMSRYENGIHEPPFLWVERLAEALGVPTAYFYCSDDRLAEIIQVYSALPEIKQKKLHSLTTGLANEN